MQFACRIASIAIGTALCVTSALPSWCSSVWPDLVEIFATRAGREIVFDLPLGSSRAPMQLDDLAIWRMSKADKTSTREALCAWTKDVDLFWHVRVNTRLFKEVPHIPWPLTYGARIPNADETVRAKRLRPGRYHICISARVHEGSEQVVSLKTLRTEFVIEDSAPIQNSGVR